MSKRAIFLIFCVLLLLCSPAVSNASEILVIKSADIKPYNESLEGFRDSCDCSATEIARSDSWQQDLSKALAVSRPDAVLAIGVDALKTAQSVKDIPVIYLMVPYLPPFASSQKNISGVSMNISAEKYLDMMADVFPNAKRIGLIYDPENSGAIVKEALQIADEKHMEIIARKAYKPGEVPPIIDNMKNRIDILWMLPDTTIVNSAVFNYMLLFSFQNEVPVVTFTKKYVEMGALAGLTVVPFDMGAQAGELVKKLLKKSSADSSIRVNARKAVLTINSKVARKMRIKIKSDNLKGAEYVQ